MSGYSRDLRERIVSSVEGGMPKAWGASSHRARRVLEGELAGYGGGEGGAREAPLRGRMRHAHLPCATLRLRAQRRAPSPFGAEKAGQEHHAPFGHDARRGGAFSGRGRGRDG